MRTLDIIILLSIWNLFGYAVMAYDKRCAIKGRSRIAEVQLITLAMLGTGGGMLLATLPPVRHKGNKISFMLPLLIATGLDAWLLYFLLKP